MPSTGIYDADAAVEKALNQLRSSSGRVLNFPADLFREGGEDARRRHLLNDDLEGAFARPPAHPLDIAKVVGMQEQVGHSSCSQARWSQAVLGGVGNTQLLQQLVAMVTEA